MRLIDADTLPIKFDGHTVSVWKNDLEAAPTINPYEWISVEDRLPEIQQEILVYRGYHSGLMNTYTYFGNNEWEDDYGYWGTTDNEGITHWMPLPIPPTVKEN